MKTYLGNPTATCLTPLALLLLAPSLRAADYYVDATAGDDSSPGAQDQPWEHCPGLAGWAGSAQLSAGDVVYFDNADTWTASSGTVLVIKGGVTYDGASWGAPGGRATLRATGSHIDHGVVDFHDDHPTAPTVLTGFEIDANNKTISGVAMARGRTIDLTGATKRIERCAVHDIFSRAADGTHQYGIEIRTYGTGTTVSNVAIIDSTVYNTPRTAIAIYAAYQTPNTKIENVLVRGCEAYNAGQDTSGATSGAGVTLKNHIVDATVEHNYLHDTIMGISVENDPGLKGPERATIRYNIVRGASQDGLFVQQSGDKSAAVYGNLVFHNQRHGLWLCSNLGGDLSLRIYNNTFYRNCQQGGWANAEIAVDGGPDIVALELINNIISPSPGSSAMSGEGRATVLSNNLTGDPGFEDASDLPTGFVGVFGVDLRPDSDGLSVVAGAASDSGADLGPPYDQSINSVPRPEGAWDIGAYQHGELVASQVPDAAAPVDAPPAQDAAPTQDAAPAQDAAAGPEEAAALGDAAAPGDAAPPEEATVPEPACSDAGTPRVDTAAGEGTVMGTGAGSDLVGEGFACRGSASTRVGLLAGLALSILSLFRAKRRC